MSAGRRDADGSELRRWYRRPLVVAALVLVSVGVLGFVGLNLIARRHAHAFLHFSEAGVRTLGPEQLSRLDKLHLLVAGITVPKPMNERSPAALGLEFSEVEITTEDGVTLSAWSVPANSPTPVGTVALFHGYAASKDSLLEAALAFHELGYACVLVDFRGSGDSSECYTTVGVREALDVRAVVSMLEQAGDSTGPIVLYGVSMGTAAILRAIAREQVRADAVILDAPFDRMITTVRNRFETMGLPAFPAAQLLVFWGGRSFEFDGWDHNPVTDAHSVSTPTLIVHGADDPRAKPDQVRAVFDALAGVREIHEFADVGHEQIAVVRAQAWRDVVSSFLRQREWGI